MVKRDIKCYTQREDFRSILKSGRGAKKPLSPSTIENYTTILMKTMRFLNIETPKELGNRPELKDASTITNLLAEYKSEHRKKQCLDTLVSAYPDLGHHYDDRRMELNTAILQQAEKNEHEGPWFSWETIQAMPNPGLLSVDHKTHMNALCFELYRLLPPLRRDWGEVRIAFNTRNKNMSPYENAIRLKPPNGESYIIELHKLTKIEPETPLVIDVSKYPPLEQTLIKSLRRSVNATNHTPPRYILQNEDGTPWDKLQITEALKGFGLSVPLLRKSYVTHVNQQNPTMEKRKQIAKMMNHSATTSLIYYNKPQAK